MAVLMFPLFGQVPVLTTMLIKRNICKTVTAGSLLWHHTLTVVQLPAQPSSDNSSSSVLKVQFGFKHAEETIRNRFSRWPRFKPHLKKWSFPRHQGLKINENSCSCGHTPSFDVDFKWDKSVRLYTRDGPVCPGMFECTTPPVFLHEIFKRPVTFLSQIFAFNVI